MRAFLRIHRGITLVTAIGLLAVLAPPLRNLVLNLDGPLALQPEVLALPMVLGSLIGEAVTTPMAEIERTAARGQRLAVLTYGLAMLSVAIISFAAALSFGRATYPWPSVVRNLIGLTGSGFLSSAWLGGRRAFVLPVGLGLALATPNLAPNSRWTWLLSADPDPLAWVFSCGLLAMGSVALILKAPISR